MISRNRLAHKAHESARDSRRGGREMRVILETVCGPSRYGSQGELRATARAWSRHAATSALAAVAVPSARMISVASM